jgi:hypothetical protein
MWLFRKDIEAGSLVTILDDFQLNSVPISILYSAKRHLPAKVSAVIDFLVDVTAGANELTPSLGNENSGSPSRASKPQVKPRARAPTGAAAVRLQTAVRPSSKRRRPS